MERIRGGFSSKPVVETAVSEPVGTRGMWVEQGELWRQRARSTVTVRPEQREAAPVPAFAHSEIVRRPLQPLATGTQPGVTVYAERRRAPHTEHIARFMTVNRTLDGGRHGDYRLVQMARKANAEYDLWKGPASRVTFLLG